MMKIKTLKKTKNTVLSEKNIDTVLKQLSKIKPNMPTQFVVYCCGKCLKQGVLNSHCSKHTKKNENKTN